MLSRSRQLASGLLPAVCAASLTALLVLSSATVATAADSDGTSKPALIALDKVITGSLVAERNATVTYTVHNVGGSPATSITLKDLSFPASRFASDKPARAQWAQLQPGDSVEHSVVLTPRRPGELFVAPAAVTYHDGEQSRVTRLAAEDSFLVEDLIAFRRRNDSHRPTWLAFFAAFVAFGIAPFAVSKRFVDSLPQLAAPVEKQKSS